MHINNDTWYKAIETRRSRRVYQYKKIQEDLIQDFNQLLENMCHGMENVNYYIKNNIVEKDVFKGIIGSYGKIKNAPHYLVLTGKAEDNNIQEKVGYIGEAFVLEAESKGIGTCWVCGTFKSSIVESQLTLASDEKIYALISFGPIVEESMEEKITSFLIRAKKRKALKELCQEENIEALEPWIKDALEAARIAPSAVNRQPWRFSIHKGDIKVSIDSPKDVRAVSKRLDCGIAMLHIEVAARKHNKKGKWIYLKNPEVAVFKVE